MGTATFTPVEGGFTFAKDLVQHIRAMYGDYFGISAAGYPEGHPQGDYKSDLKFLKEKVDAGADFIITQLFYDCDSFLDFVKDCREIGIQCPILPGIMPIYKYSSFKKMTDFCKTKVPQCILDDLSKIDKDNDADVQAYGIKLAITMCRKLIDNGVKGLHFYTLNLQKSIVKIMEGLNLLPESIQRTLPWRVSANANRQKEEVRPIFWANRPESYLHRTCSWEDFPAGRWGSDTLHFDEIDDYRLLVGIASKELVCIPLQF
jgi:methylenetetrahydrofolate reductase (NADPH)